MKKKSIAVWMNCIGLLAGLCGCGANGVTTTDAIQGNSVEVPVMLSMNSVANVDVRTLEERQIDAYMESMSLEEKVGQLFYISTGALMQPEHQYTDVVTQITEHEVASLKTYQPGGIIVMGPSMESDSQVRTLIRDLQNSSKIPLFIGVDEEGGVVSRMGDNENISVPNHGDMSVIGVTNDPERAYALGATLAEELRPYGINMDFAPVTDVLTNPNNYEIGNRSFGSDPQLVGSMAAKEVAGLQENGISAVTKHFPGHGDVSGNSHNNMQLVDTDVETLMNREFVSFRQCIDADTDTILVSHLVLTHVDAEHPSCLSKEVVNGLLRQQLGYDGVVMTDSFQMGSITDNYSQGEASVMALEAGCDMVLMPLEYDAAYRAVLDAVASGRMTEEQINEKCYRILRLKAKRGLLDIKKGL